MSESSAQHATADDAPIRCQTAVEITHGTGLHARPSVIFTRLAKSFRCAVEIEVDGSGTWLNGKSIVKVMGARVRKGSVLGIRAEGAGAQEAIKSLRELVEHGFGENGRARA